MSPTTNPKNETAIYAATRQANSFGSMLTRITLITGFVLLGWMAAHSHLGAPPASVGLARLTMFLAGLWFVFNAAKALINHTILTGYRVGVETLALTATTVFQMMQSAQAEADADATDQPAPPPPPPPSAPTTVTYLQDAIRRRAEQDTPKKDA